LKETEDSQKTEKRCRKKRKEKKRQGEDGSKLKGRGRRGSVYVGLSQKKGRSAREKRRGGKVTSRAEKRERLDVA